MCSQGIRAIFYLIYKAIPRWPLTSAKYYPISAGGFIRPPPQQQYVEAAESFAMFFHEWGESRHAPHPDES